MLYLDRLFQLIVIMKILWIGLNFAQKFSVETQLQNCILAFILVHDGVTCGYISSRIGGNLKRRLIPVVSLGDP
jgi:hypothetical protein